MSRSRKITLLAAGAIVGLLALGAVAVKLLMNESRLEAAVSKALGMDVAIGRASIDFFPSLHVTLKDMHIWNRGVELIATEHADFGIEFLPLLVLKVRFRNIALERYRISIERDVDGQLSYKSQDPQRVRPPLDLVNVSLSDGTLHYVDQQSRKGFELTGCNLDVPHLSHSGGKSAELLRRLSITMEFVCAEVHRNDAVWSDLQGSMNGNDGIFEFEPVTLLAFGGQGSGSVEVDRSGPVPRVHARYSLQKFHIEEFLKVVSPEKAAAQGPMDLTVDLRMQGSTANELRQTAHGDVSLVGENLTLDSTDLDKELSRYASTQRFNLVDVGALFLAGPLGLGVTKGYSFASLLRGPGGRTQIRTLVSKWKVERGVAHAQDVALATNENRLALHGGLDFVNEEFDDVTVGVVDEDGCPKVIQKVVGPFQKPVLEKPFFLKSMAGPAIKLFKQIRDLFPNKGCEVFYEGSLPPPAPSKS